MVPPCSPKMRPSREEPNRNLYVLRQGRWAEVGRAMEGRRARQVEKMRRESHRIEGICRKAPREAARLKLGLLSVLLDVAPRAAAATEPRTQG